MKRNLFIFFSMLFGTAFAQSNNFFGVQFGYNNGFGAKVQYTTFNFIKENPIHLRLSLGYTRVNPGNSDDVRRIFINNATNGTPEKKGRTLDAKLDFLISIKLLNDSYLNVGPRYAGFKGNFKYVGGNEDFDIVSNHFGFGVGVGNFFKINSNMNMEINAGFDYFIPSTLTGHDTSYSPDNENVNAQNDNQNNNEEFTYEDADKSVNQPKYSPFLMLGFNYKL